MSIFADTRQTAARFEPYIEAFRVLFRTHAIDFGSIENFIGLEPKLDSDRAFRTDFTSLANAIAAKENGTLSVTEILTIVAVALGGSEVDRNEREIAAPLSALVVFLAGIGGWKTQQSQSPPPTQAPGISNPEPESLELAPNPSADLEFTHVSHEQADGQIGTDIVEGTPVDDSFRMPPRIQEILDRLELNSVQLKLYLDDIDRRMGRIEPHIEDITSVVHSSAQYFQQLKNEPAQTAGDLTERKLRSEHIPDSPIHIHKRTPEPVIPVQVQDQSRGQNSAQVSQPILAPKQEPIPDPPVSAPPLLEALRSMAESDLKQVRRPQQSSAALLGIILIVLLTSGVALAFFYSNKRPLDTAARPSPSADSGHELASVAQNTPVAAPDASTSEIPSNTAGSATQPTGITSAASDHLIKTEVKKKSASQLSTSSSASDKPAQQQPAPVPFRPALSSPNLPGQQITNSVRAEPEVVPSSLAVSNSAVSKVTPPTTEAAPFYSSPSGSPSLSQAVASTPAKVIDSASTERASLKDAPTPIVRSTPPSTRPLEVSSVFMTANLLSAPKPPYPPDAIFHGIEGTVVLRALISKSGSVESLRIISGPIGLQQTTLATVQKWRFKPYLVNGHPIEVGTTLNVVFHLHQ